MDIAVVGLHPNDKGRVPDGSRPGQFAQAPTVGEIATGEVKGGIGVPNLTIHDDRKALPPPHVDAPRKVVLYADRLRSLPVSTLSVPLHPASRTIPPSIEARFRGRNVYTMVIPIENLPEYTADWIIWFAEHDSKPGAPDVLNVRAPIPLRKFESVEPVPPGARTELRVQIAGVITKEGKLEVRNLAQESHSRLRERGAARHAILGVQAGHARWRAGGYRRRSRDSVQPSAAGSAKRYSLTSQPHSKKKQAPPSGTPARLITQFQTSKEEDYAFACAARRF